MGGSSDETSLHWEPGDVPCSGRYADPYFSREDGLAETRHVFLDGTGLPERWAGRRRFAVAELGFGAGLNFAATLTLWRQTAGVDARLDYTAFELAPLAPGEIRRALRRWPGLRSAADVLSARWPGASGGVAEIGPVRLTLIVGDARQTVPQWSGAADAWFLDGFAPARNPEMWEPALLAAVFARTRPGGRLATYSAAGRVRRALLAAGFAVERMRGYGQKREMLRGLRPA